MARHRGVRKMDLDNEMSEDVYGRSYEDDFAVSPGTKQQYSFKRNDREDPTVFSFLTPNSGKTGKKQRHRSGQGTKQGDDTATKQSNTHGTIDPLRFNDPEDDSLVQLESGKEYIVSVVGDQFGEEEIVEALQRCDLNAQIALNELLMQKTLKSPTAPPPTSTRGFPSFAPHASQITDQDKSVLSKKVGTAAILISSSSEPTPSSSLQASPTPDRSPSPQSTGQVLEAVSIAPSSSPKLKLPNIRSLSKSKNQTDVLSEYTKLSSSSKSLINLVVIGHVDAGKSTLMGHLLYLLGEVTKKAMHKFRTESEKLGKSSFVYAWVLDETGEERHRGITMDIASRRFETSKRIVNLLDAPGHRDFIPNMITGTAQADVAVMVVGATMGEFESGFESGGQTREHAMLARSLGVKQMVVTINKMDMVNWSKERFDAIVGKLGAFLKQTGFKDSDVSYVPCSGLNGENLITKATIPELIKWYNGPSLIEEIDKMEPPLRPVDKPFRCCVSDIFKGQGVGVSIAGRIEQGHTQNGNFVLVAPAMEFAIIKSVTISNEDRTWGVAGDHVIISLVNIDPNKLTIGSVLCDPEKPVKVCTRFRARVIVFSPEYPITPGFPVVLHYLSVEEVGTVTKLVSQLNKSTGEVIKKRPKCLTKQMTAILEIEASRPVCLELYSDCRELGRFMLRNSGSTIAAGVVTLIYAS